MLSRPSRACELKCQQYDDNADEKRHAPHGRVS